jgi:hypothetical protein
VAFPNPPDPATIDPLTERLRKGSELVRVQELPDAPDVFNPTLVPGRFRPFRSGRQVVATAYAAVNVDAALSETIFRTIPLDDPNPRVLRSQLYGRVRARLSTRRDFTLVSLRGAGLRRLRTTAADLIHTDSTTYPATARFAAALYRCRARPDGLVWDSRLHPGSAAIILFGTRVKPSQLSFDWDDVEPLWKGVGLEEVNAAAENAGVTVVM